jgi:hypothetical protein
MTHNRPLILYYEERLKPRDDHDIESYVSGEGCPKIEDGHRLPAFMATSETAVRPF